MDEIKTDKNTSGVLYQDRTNSVSSVTSKACDVASSRRPISNSNGHGLTVKISIDVFHQSH